MKKISSKKGKDGYYHFYVGKKDITEKWMWFHSGLTLQEESDCERLFFKKYPTLTQPLKKG